MREVTTERGIRARTPADRSRGRSKSEGYRRPRHRYVADGDGGRRGWSVGGRAAAAESPATRYQQAGGVVESTCLATRV